MFVLIFCVAVVVFGVLFVCVVFSFWLCSVLFVFLCFLFVFVSLFLFFPKQRLR